MVNVIDLVSVSMQIYLLFSLIGQDVNEKITAEWDSKKEFLYTKCVYVWPSSFLDLNMLYS